MTNLSAQLNDIITDGTAKFQVVKAVTTKDLAALESSISTAADGVVTHNSSSSAHANGISGNAANVTGTVTIAHGGTGQTTVAAARNALGLGNTSGALPIANGGTGQTTIAAARNALGLGNTDGALPVANGGTGQTTAAAARNALGLGNTTGALPIANGGTGQTTAAAARNALGLGNTTGALPVANGGTGQTSIADIQAGKDGAGDTITDKYATKANAITGLSVSSETLTYTKGNGDEDTVTIQVANSAKALDNYSAAEIMAMISSAGSSTSQVTKQNVIASSSSPKEIEIEIASTETFNKPPVEILKFEAGATITVTKYDFNNGEASDFTSNPYVIFDGTMHPNTVGPVITMSTPTALSTGYMSYSGDITISNYQSVKFDIVTSGEQVITGIAQKATGGNTAGTHWQTYLGEDL